MNRKIGVAPIPQTQQKINEIIIDAIQDIKGKKILEIDLRALPEAPTNYFIICEADSTVQIKAISENIHKRVKEDLGLMPNHIEGMDGAKWILVDYFDIVVHIFYPETREFYEIEDLWGDAPMRAFADV